MSIEDLRLFLRIDGTDEDAFISSLQLAAIKYLTNAGADKDESNPLYVLAIKMLVGHWYENRAPIGSAGKLEFSLNTIILQIKCTQPEVV